MGANQSYTEEDIAAQLSIVDVPIVWKYTFEKWSIYNTTTDFTGATTEEQQRSLLTNAQHLYSYAWSSANSGAIQLLLLSRLLSDPDIFDSPHDLRESLIIGAVKDSQHDQVIDAIELAYNASTGPFYYLQPRPGAASISEELFAKYPSTYIAEELHAYTQLEMVRRTDHLQSWVFRYLLCNKARLEALPKIRRDDDETPENLRASLLFRSTHPNVKAEIDRRYKSNEAPFNVRA
jgi:hypothetical protein